MRVRVAELLHQTGALGALMQLRRLAPIPSLPIITYHHIADDDPTYAYDPTIADATPAQFRRQMELLTRHFTPIGVEELVRAIDGDALPKNPIMVTFDDGYRSCHDTALPILRAVGVRATFFISTSFVEERRVYWWERISMLLRRANNPRATIVYPETIEIDCRDTGVRDRLNAMVKNTASLDIERFLAELARALDVESTRAIESECAAGLLMTWDHVRVLAREGMDVESHGRRHRVLQTLGDDELVDELVGSRIDLEAQLGRPVRAFAYPVGRRIVHERRLRVAIAAAGYRVGLSNASGVNRVWPSPLRGVFPWDPFDVRRLSTDREMTDDMYLTQIAIPRFAYTSRYNRG